MAITKINTPEIFDLGATNSSLRLPSGNTASRPSSPSTGEWRYNTDDNKVEYWDGSAWFQIDYETPTPVPIVPLENFSPTTYSGNGSTNVLSSKIGNAGYFDGSSSYISVGNPIPNTDTDFTISAWINLSSGVSSNMHITGTGITTAGSEAPFRATLQYQSANTFRIFALRQVA